MTVRLQPSSKIGDDWPYQQAKPVRTGLLQVDVDPDHSLYWEEYGSPTGAPVMVLHGGPGGSSSPTLSRFFDLARYRVILFDQRGCGKSVPTVAAAGSAVALAKNTTRDLTLDINKLRDALGIDRPMHLFGGSWGSTLAMVYAITFPENCASLVLRGIFLGEAEDLRYMYQGNAATFAVAPFTITEPGAYISYPDEWRAFLSVLSPVECNDVMAAYKKIFDLAPCGEVQQNRQLDAALAWSMWEGVISNLVPEPAAAGKFADKEFALSFAQIEAHYFANKLFLEPGYLIRNAAALARVPLYIVHGRFDQVCPLAQASRLVDELRAAGAEPASFVITSAGHSAMERENVLALVDIMDGLAQ